MLKEGSGHPIQDQRNLPSPEEALNRASTSTKYFHLHTPAFYCRDVSYQDLNVALAGEVRSIDAAENRTAEVSHMGELCTLLIRVVYREHNVERHRHEPKSVSDRFAWKLVAVLKRQADSYPSHGPPRQRYNNGDGLKTLSPFYRWKITSQRCLLAPSVWHACTRDERKKYQRTVMRFLLVKRIALGSVARLQRYWLLSHFGVSAVASRMVARMSTSVWLR